MSNSEAREIANLVKTGDPDKVGERLMNDAFAMDRPSFNNLMKEAANENAKDLKSNSSLPGLDIDDKDQEITRFSLTTPGKYLGNLSRDKKEFFFDVHNRADGTPGYFYLEDDWYVAREGTHVISENNAKVASKGSNIDAQHSQILADKDTVIEQSRGSVILALPGAHVNKASYSQIVQCEGAVVEAGRGTSVDVRPGAKLTVSDRAFAQAEAGSEVEVLTGGTVKALPGSRIKARDGQVYAWHGAIIDAQPPATVTYVDGTEK